jgi:hypothetical protein
MAGKVDTPNGIVDKDNTSNVPRALLADFGVDSSVLRPDHVVWLDGLATFLRRHAFPPTKGKWVITITGRASKTGSDYHNRLLSERRCNEVRKHLGMKLVGVSIEFAPTYLGEASPFNSKINENARDRSVEVFVVASVAPIRIDPEPAPGGEERKKVFDLVVTDFLVHTLGLSDAVIPGVPGARIPLGWCWWKMNLTITDPDTDDTEQYFFEGDGACPLNARGMAPFEGWSRAAKIGKIQPFVASSKHKADSFEGRAQIALMKYLAGQFHAGGELGNGFAFGKANKFVLQEAFPGLPVVCAASGTLKFGFKHIPRIP